MATPSQRWCLALSAVLTELNKGYHHELGGWGAGEHTAGWCKNVLAKFWNIHDAASFRQAIDWLWNTGSRTEVLAILNSLGPDPKQDDDKQELARVNRTLLEGRGLLAWDLGRYVAVVGWGKWAGYISEPEAWRLIHGAGTWAQRSFKSWREYGRHYEFGRYWWSGEDDPRVEAIIEKLKTDASSPWIQLDWALPLGPAPEMPKKARIKRTQCRMCGAPKQVPPKTGWVYCDCCGTLADWDFRKACEGGSALPGPAYEAILRQVGPQLEKAKAAANYDACLEIERKIFAAWVEACPKAVPPRAAEPAYRTRYIEYMARANAATDVDAEWQMLAVAVKGATGGIRFEGNPLKPRVRSQAFWSLHGAVKQQLERGAAVYAEAGVYELQPDEAPRELQRSLDWSVFAQGWIPYLEDADVERLLAESGLSGDYDEVPDVHFGTRHCGHCGGELSVVDGARCVVCEACGHRVDVSVAEIKCGQCAGMISLPQGEARGACPFCQSMVVRV
jgi:hypothetical protein